MKKWIVILLGLATPAMAAKLRGVVGTEDIKEISGARVIVLNEMATMFLQQGMTDSKGVYIFNLSPGLYHIFIIKDGYQILHTKALIVHPLDELNYQHLLVPKAAVSEDPQATFLKKKLRENRDHREMVLEPLEAIAWTPAEREDLFTGALRTESRQDLQGNTAYISSVELETPLAAGVALHSSVSNEHREHDQTEHFSARLMVDLENVDLDIDAESIRVPTNQLLGYSKAAGVTGTYGEEVRSATHVTFKQSRLARDEERELSLHQEAVYTVGNGPMRHDARLTSWQRNGEDIARFTTLATDWQTGGDDALGLAADMDYLELGPGRYTTARLWLTGERHVGDNLAIWSRLGLHREQSQSSMVQRHRAAVNLGAWQMLAEFSRDIGVAALASSDVFGDYLVRPELPFLHEGFYRNDRALMALQIGLNYGPSWTSTLRWEKHDEEALLLATEESSPFKAMADRNNESFAYTLRSVEHGARVEIHHNRQQSGQNSLESSELIVGQALNPFRNKALALMFEFRLKSNPYLPAWWLLEEGMQAEGEGTMYESRLSLQF